MAVLDFDTSPFLCIVIIIIQKKSFVNPFPSFSSLLAVEFLCGAQPTVDCLSQQVIYNEGLLCYNKDETEELTVPRRKETIL